MDPGAEYNVIQEFVDRVNREAEAEMAKTHKLEGAHHRAMVKVLQEYKDSAIEHWRYPA